MKHLDKGGLFRFFCIYLQKVILSMIHSKDIHGFFLQFELA